MRWSLIGFLAGFLGNLLFDRPIDKLFETRGLNLMARYAVGGLLTLLVAGAMLRSGYDRTQRMHILNVYTTAFLTVGAGVGFARAMNEFVAERL